MKAIIKILVLSCVILFFNTNCKAQTYPKPGDHFYDNGVDKFVGTWLWIDGNNSFKITLKKEHVSFMPLTKVDIYSDVLYGFHKMIKNSIVEESSLDFSNTTFQDKKWTILTSSDDEKPNILRGTIRHLSKNKSVVLIIEYIDANHIKIISIKNSEGVKFSTPDNPYDSSISLPENIILTRQ